MLFSEGKYQKWRTGEDEIELGGRLSNPTSSRTWEVQTRGPGFRVTDRKQG